MLMRVDPEYGQKIMICEDHSLPTVHYRTGFYHIGDYATGWQCYSDYFHHRYGAKPEDRLELIRTKRLRLA